MAAGPGRPSGQALRIVHLSDPHFGTVVPAVEEALLATIQSLAPSLIIISGDITQRARRAQFAAAGRFVAALAPLPVLAIPGNHDIPLYNVLGRLMRPYSGFQRTFGPELEPAYEQDGVQVLGFVSAPRWRHKHGDIRPERVTARLRQFESPTALLRVAVFHHPFDYVEEQDRRNLIRRHEELARRLAAARVDLVLGGHIHDALARTTEHRYPGLERPFVIAQAGTALSWRIRYRTPNTFNLLTLQAAAGEMVVERWDCEPTDERHQFRCVTRDRFGRADDGWTLHFGR
ncbi:MAG: metallophosphoesterase [Spongiibacteraceae bacterium]|nr:metallophosphoesterase [Spongiibacteraceae bacterium]